MNGWSIMNSFGKLYAVLVMGGAVLGAAAQSGAAEPQTIAQIQAAAMKEGTLVWYAALRSDQADLLAQNFMKAYPGIKVDTIHLTSSEITARTMMEQRGRRYNADVLCASSFAMSQLKAEGLLEQFILPGEATTGLAKGSFDPNGYWLSEYALTYPVSYNPQKLAADKLSVPTSFADFTKPEWRGKFAVSTDYYDWYQGLTQYMGHDKAKALAMAMAANKPLIRSNSGVILELLEAGEFAATFDVFGYNTFADEKQGKPVKILNISPVVALMQTGGIALHAPHPNAAKLFQIWMASKATQQFMSSVLGRTSTHTQIDNIPEVWNPKAVDYVLLDPDKQVKTARQFESEYNGIFGIGVKSRAAGPKL